MQSPQASFPDGLDDAALMTQVRDGSDEAFALLVRRHQRPLLNFFFRMGVYNGAEDLAQETLLRVYRARQRYRPEARFTTFLYTIARHVAVDGFRRVARRRRLQEAVEAETPTAGDGGLPALRARLDVREALASLPANLREVVVLAVFEGLRYEEIGNVLGIPEGTVKSRMFTAVARLREYFHAKPG
jgi:RNA polymerase sigma-70 factor (ECF subfamily)